MTFSFQLWNETCVLDHKGNLDWWSLVHEGRFSSFNISGQLECHGSRIAHFGVVIFNENNCHEIGEVEPTAFIMVKTEEEIEEGRPPRYYRVARNNWENSYLSEGARQCFFRIDSAEFSRAIVGQARAQSANAHKHPMFK